MSDARILKIKN